MSEDHSFQSNLELRRFRCMMDQAGEAILLTDTSTGKFVDMNQTALDWLGYSKEELSQIGPPEIGAHYEIYSAEEWQYQLAKTNQPEKPQTVLGRHIRKDGSSFPVEVSISWKEFDEKLFRLAVVRDISDRDKRAEQDKANLVAAVEQADESILITNTNGTIYYVNPAFLKITGYSREEVLGKNPRILKSGKHDADFYNRMWQTLLAGEVWSDKIINRKKNGALYEEVVTISPIRDDAGKIINFVAVKHDVTYKSLLEKQLRESQKMEAMGTLAGGIAHDFNNILCAMLGYINIARDMLEDDTSAKKDLDLAIQSGERAEELINQIITFSRQGEQELRPVKISAVIKESAKMMRAMLPSTIEMDINIQEDTGTVLADPTQLHQVLMNLCTNAQHAMQKKEGLLRINLTKSFQDQEFSNLHEVPAGDYVKLEVIDNGCGISEKNIDRVFDPFFTTKPVDEGTGLGLAVIHGIIKNHQGVITVNSTEGEGSCFSVYIRETDSQENKPGKVARKNLSGNERILFVDDEKLLINVHKRAIERFGYEVDVTSNSLEALRWFEEDPEKYDAVITDQVMPQLTGDKLAEKMLKIRPDLTIVLVTGYDPHMTHEKAKKTGIKGFHKKPVLSAKLCETLRTLLDE